MVAAEPQSSTMVPPFPRDPDWGKEGRNMETIIGIVLALLLGVWLGYRWREHISQQHRAQYLAGRFARKKRRLKALLGDDLVSRIPTRKNLR